ncbi:MAG: RND transporter [Gammaproteobacteria bacterium]|nr:MAG: RND transporter [Gammaproteobacteria bacterium]
MKPLVLILTIVVNLTASCVFLVNAQNYDIAEVTVEPYNDTIHRTGKLAYKRTLNLSFKSSGYLTELTVDEGGYFIKDQLLARLDIAELIEDKNGKYAQLLQAKRDVKRITKLMENNLSSQQQLDNAETLVETSRALYKVAYYNLQKSQIAAPFDGIVLNRFTELGELQTPGREVLRVAALKNNWVVKVALTDREVSQVRLKQKVRVRLGNLGEVIGLISKIPATANNQSNLFTIEVLLPQLTRRAGIIAGQIAEVIIDFTDNKLVYRVPIAALVAVDEQGKAIVVTQSSGGKQLQQQLFDIYKLDNRFIYLVANADSPPLQLITQGWQNFSLNTSLNNTLSDN